MSEPPGPIRAVFFDVGETLLDEGRSWGGWADWLGVPRHTFFAALGAIVERRAYHRDVFEMVRPGFDLEREREKRAAAGVPEEMGPEDLYADAAPCLEALSAAGYRIGLVGNQPAWMERVLDRLGLPVDVLGSSEGWGVAKPAPAFFARVVEAAGVPAPAIAYVGDRLDNDVLPARRAGMLGVFLRRGPWGVVHATWPEVAQADLVLESLAELPAALVSFARPSPRGGAPS